jgi:hypothetical protein
MSSGRSSTTVTRVLWAALAYFTAAFALGFFLGALRTGALAMYPAMGRLGAVALEVPVMLGGCWWICDWIVATLEIPAAWGVRAAMGGLAFVLLQGAEIALGATLMNLDLAEQVALVATPAGALGLAAQVAFGLFPLFVGVRASRDTR